MFFGGMVVSLKVIMVVVYKDKFVMVVFINLYLLIDGVLN